MVTHVPYPRECGGTSHVRGVANELRRRGHEVMLCAKAEPGLGEVEVEGMPVRRFSWAYRDMFVSQAYHRWRHGVRVAGLAREWGAAVIYEREHAMGAGTVAARLTGLPHACEVNDLWYHPPMLEHASRIVSNSGSVRAIIPERHHHKTVWVHSSVDAGMFEGARPAPVPEAEGRRLVCYTGTLLAWHAVADMARALPAVLEEVPEAALLVVGEPTTPEGRANLGLLEEAARKAGDPDAVVHLGLVPYGDVPGVMAACEVGIAVYNLEREEALRKVGFWYSPMKMWDYMAAGLPTVATDLPNLRDIVGDDRGLLVPEGDPSAVAGAVVGLLRDEGLRSRMGEAAREFARANSWEHRVDDYERALEETVEGGG